jgi:hypothetical protein
MKKLYTAITLILLITFLCLSDVSAQRFPVYKPSFDPMMTNMNMNMLMMARPWYHSLGYTINNKYTYYVTMKDSSVLEIRSKIYADTLNHKSYLIYNNTTLKHDDPNRKQKIYADQTLKINREWPNGIRSLDVIGIPTDSCWLFNVVKGKINIYSHLSEVEQLNNLYLRAFQTGNGPIQKIDSASLVVVIKDDPKAMKDFLKKDYFKAIRKYNSDSK